MRAIVLAALLASPAYAQQTQCAPTPQAYENLTNQHMERREFSGVVHDMSGLVEIWVGQNSDNWTLLATTPNGVSCIITYGVGYSGAKQPEPNL
jgi:hypothetical protein